MSTTSLLLVYFPWTCILFPTINHDSINARSPEVRVPMFSSPIYSFRKCLERMAHHSMMAPQYLHQLLLFGARDNIRHVNCTLHLLQLYTVWPLIYICGVSAIHNNTPRQHPSTRPNVNVVSIFSVLNFPSFEADAFSEAPKAIKSDKTRSAERRPVQTI